MTHYLDHAATTPMLPAAVEALAEQAARVGNASSLHTSGRAARAVVEEARERIAGVLGARPSEVVFTSGGTEADNLAVKGTYAARLAADPARTRLVVGGIEHHAVLDPVEFLAEQGARVTWLEPDRCGHLSVDDLRERLAEHPDDVALASVMWANNEVGTVQPIAELAAVAHEHGVPFHTDAVQAVAHLPVRFDESGADLMTISAHKVGGPLGVGALLARRDATLVPLAHGGGQERQVRSGTLDVPGIRAFAVALEETVASRDVEAKRVMGLRDHLLEGALALGLGITVTGCWSPGDGTPPPPRQRPRARARLRGRLPPLPPRRRGRRVQHGLRVPGGRPAAQPRAARHGPHRVRGQGSPTADLRPHVDRGRRRRLPRCPPGGRRAGATGERPALMRVVAAMSGGVDSAVAAARMLDAGHEVVGVHLALSRSAATLRESARGCCTLEDAGDARRVADRLGIPFYVWDLASRFERDVVEDFVAEYAAGRTPNPCLRCNERIKFAGLLDKAVALGFDAVATGHYARVVDGVGGRELHRAVDVAKDQSYVLGVLDADQLARAFFPLGDSTKPQVREEAAARGFSVARKPDSHDICFIPDGDTRGWLTRRLGDAAR